MIGLTERQLDIFEKDLELYSNHQKLNEIDMYESVFGVTHPSAHLRMKIIQEIEHAT